MDEEFMMMVPLLSHFVVDFLGKYWFL